VLLLNDLSNMLMWDSGQCSCWTTCQICWC